MGSNHRGSKRGPSGVGAFIVAAGLSWASVSFADMPAIQINSPTAGSTVYAAAFPYVANIAFTINHSELKDTNVLNVKVDDTSIFTGGQPIGNPFDNNNACGAAMALPNIASCNTYGTASADVTARWTVSQPGTYAITVILKHRGAEGMDEEEGVVVALMNVEYPAPPAVANGYLKSAYPRLKGSVHGCVISKIANAHAMEERYGAKGGPYVESLITSDAVAFMGACGG